MHSSAALRRLLHEVIDYAGLFPPAGLEMEQAVRNYAIYRTSQHAWMLGRFVAPAGRLEELAHAVHALRSPPRPRWRISAVLGVEPQADLELIERFNRTHAGVLRADSIELRVSDPREVERPALRLRERFECFMEFPLSAEQEPFVRALATARVMAKARTGGVTPEAIPDAARLAQFLIACAEAGVSFKATAGLHHPLRSEHRLTYDDQAPRAVMHGFLNVFVAAALAAKGVRGTELEAVLEEEDLSAISLNEAVRWRGWKLNEEDVRAGRSFARAFGSCSFTEPVDDLVTLNLL